MPAAPWALRIPTAQGAGDLQPWSAPAPAWELAKAPRIPARCISGGVGIPGTKYAQQPAGGLWRALAASGGRVGRREQRSPPRAHGRRSGPGISCSGLPVVSAEKERPRPRPRSRRSGPRRRPPRPQTVQEDHTRGEACKDAWRPWAASRRTQGSSLHGRPYDLSGKD